VSDSQNHVINCLAGIPFFKELFAIYHEGHWCMNADQGSFATHTNEPNMPYVRTKGPRIASIIRRHLADPLPNHPWRPSVKGWMVIELLSQRVWTAEEFVALYPTKAEQRRRKKKVA
jgi:hypothetical protein